MSFLAFSFLAVNSAVRRTQARLWARAVRALSWPRERRGTLASRGDVHHRVGRGDKVGRPCQSARSVHRISSSRRALIAVLVPPALMCHMCPCHRPGCAADASNVQQESISTSARTIYCSTAIGESLAEVCTGLLIRTAPNRPERPSLQALNDATPEIKDEAFRYLGDAMLARFSTDTLPVGGNKKQGGLKQNCLIEVLERSSGCSAAILLSPASPCRDRFHGTRE